MSILDVLNEAQKLRSAFTLDEGGLNVIAICDTLGISPMELHAILVTDDLAGAFVLGISVGLVYQKRMRYAN